MKIISDNSTFIGTGHNPDGPDLPLGFGMQLAQEPKAMEAYGKLSRQEKAAVIRRVQGSATGEEAKNRIAKAVADLRDGNISFN